MYYFKFILYCLGENTEAYSDMIKKKKKKKKKIFFIIIKYKEY